MTELREIVAGETIFIKLDPNDGYHWITIRKDDKWKTAFRKRYGHYKYKVIPIGLQNAPATFQAMINEILREFPDQGVVLYLDDILIYSKSLQEHEKLVKQVLARLEKHHLAVSLTKSVFHVRTVELLEYIVNTVGVTISERKVESIMK